MARLSESQDFGQGGLAIALGAQKSIEHFVASMSLIADRPIRGGDFCAVDGIQGTVEDIGMCSTRLIEQMRQVLDCLRELLLEDRRVMAEPARVRFVNFGPSSLYIEIFAYVRAVDYNEFFAAEDLHSGILEIVPAFGACFASPSTTADLEGAGEASAAQARPAFARDPDDLQLPLLDFRLAVVPGSS